MKITRSVDINAPIEQVFDVIDDPEKLKIWAEGVVETIHTKPYDPANPVGSTFVQRIKEGRRINEYQGEVVAYDKPRHLAIHLGSKQFTMRVDYHLNALDANRTRLDYRADMISGTWAAKIMGRLFAALTNRILDRQLMRLKTLAETGQ